MTTKLPYVVYISEKEKREICVLNGIPYYRSTGKNSFLAGTWLPFIAIFDKNIDLSKLDPQIYNQDSLQKTQKEAPRGYIIKYAVHYEKDTSTEKDTNMKKFESDSEIYNKYYYSDNKMFNQKLEEKHNRVIPPFKPNPFTSNSGRLPNKVTHEGSYNLEIAWKTRAQELGLENKTYIMKPIGRESVLSADYRSRIVKDVPYQFEEKPDLKSSDPTIINKWLLANGAIAIKPLLSKAEKVKPNVKEETHDLISFTKSFNGRK